MSDANNKLIYTLRKHGYSATRPRQAVFTSLVNNEPVTIASLIASLRNHVDRASVYRTVALFEKLGIIIRINQGWKFKIELSDDFNDHHHHMLCIKCGKLLSIQGDSHIEHDLHELAKKLKFVITKHQVEVQGFCINCKQD